MSASCDPIYDLIENDKYPEAIKYAQRVEVRQMPLAQALQSYCLLKLNKRNDALEVARAAMSAFSTDENVHSVLKQTLRGCRREPDLAAYLETLSQVYPERAPQYCRELFHMYTFLQDAKKMQLTAQRLYKLTSQRCFVFWSVASMLLQDGLPRTMLTVAERMLTKVLDEAAAQPGAEELELLVDVLCRQDRFAEALAKLDALTARSAGAPIADQADLEGDSAAVKMGALKKSILRVRLLELAGAAAQEGGKAEEAEMLAEVRRQLETNPDQWDCHRRLVAMVVRAQQRSESEDAGEGADSSVTPLVSHRNFLASIRAKQPYLRGPRLAEIELLLLHWQSSPGAGGDLPAGWIETPVPEGLTWAQPCSPLQRECSSLLAAYVASFQTKQCCFGDVRTYLALLAGRGAAWAARGPPQEGGARLPQPEGLPVLGALRAWALAGAAALEVELAAMAPPAPAAKGKKKKGKEGKEGDASAAGAEARERVVEKLCASSKMRQIAVHCAHLLAPSAAAHDSLLPPPPSSASSSPTPPSPPPPNPFADENVAVALYQSTKRLCSGGVGGDKEVQPGDEILLVQSARHRLLTLGAMAAGERGEGRIPQAAEVAVRCVRWLRLLLLGSECSPHAFAFRVDMLEPLRLLGVGEAALACFHQLRPKHMQNDSLAYLVAPALLEAGLLGEAREVYVRLTKFALSARGDTSDMMAKALDKGNYATCLQMNAFLCRVAGSLQLHVAFSENALLELTLNEALRNPPDACTHLKHFSVSPAISASTANDAVRPLLETRGAGLLTDEDLAGLTDNGDYELLVRCDATGLAEAAEARSRRAQLEGRIRLAQVVHRALYHVLEGEVAEGQGYVDRLAAMVAGGEVGGGGYFLWSQEVWAGAVGRGEGGDAYSAALWEAIVTGMRFSLSCCRMVQAAVGQGSKAADAQALKAEAAALSGGLGAADEAEGLTAEALAAAINADLAEMAIAGAGGVVEGASDSASASAGVAAGVAAGGGVGASTDANAAVAVSTPPTYAYPVEDMLSCMGQVQAESQALAAASAAAFAGLKDFLLQTAGPHSRYLPAPEGRAKEGAKDGKDGKDGKGAALVCPLSGDWVRRVSAFSRTLATYLPLLLSAALISLPSSAGDRKEGKGANKAGRDKDKDKARRAAAASTSTAVVASGDKGAHDDGDSDRNQERWLASYRDVGDACRQVAEGLVKLTDALQRVLGDAEVDLQTSDDYGPFFAAWDAALAEADGSGAGGGAGGAWGEGAPSLATVSQQLHSGQLMSVQRLRAALSSQVDALRRWLAHTAQAGYDGGAR